MNLEQLLQVALEDDPSAPLCCAYHREGWRMLLQEVKSLRRFEGTVRKHYARNAGIASAFVKLDYERKRDG